MTSKATGIIITAFILSITHFACNKGEKETATQTASQGGNNKKISFSVLLKELEFPWGLAYLPNGDLLFTERPGRINLLKKDVVGAQEITSRSVQQNSEGGLLGIAVDPDYSNNNLIYIYETGTASNRVVRFKFTNDVLSDEKTIVNGIPKNGNHNGGVVRFGPDGFLYIGTGDAQNPQLSQDLNSLAGKILRVDRNGNAASGNPFGNHVWSYGHRNVQGLAWTENGNLIATEHGPSGDFGWCCHDELNLIEKGKNFGWPMVHAGEETDTLVAPLAHSGNDTWAPSGCEFTGDLPFWKNNVVVCCLRGKRLIRFNLNESQTKVISQADTLQGTFDRLRNIIKGPEGTLVFCTSNGNDQIFRISLK